MTRRSVERLHGHALPVTVVVLAAAVAHLCFGMDQRLLRDEAIYAYAGQQMIRGTPPYVSIFDAKTPGASLVCGLGAAVAATLGTDDLAAMRITYFILSLVAAASVYLLAASLFRSHTAALLSAFLFIGFRGFAIDALSGPNAKTAALAFELVCLVLTVRRTWFWAGVFGSLAFLTWQPLGACAAATLLLAWARGSGRAPASSRVAFRARRGRTAVQRALAGVAAPLVATLLYFLATGALDDLIEGTVLFNLGYLEREENGLGVRLGNMLGTLWTHYRVTAIPIAVGLGFLFVVLVVLLHSRRWNVFDFVRRDRSAILALTMIPAMVWSLVDFQGYPDWYPLLPFAALGFGGAVKVALDFRWDRADARIAACTAICTVLFAATLVDYLTWDSARLTRQRAVARAVMDSIGGDGTIAAVGSPTLLVLTHSTNFSPYIFLNSGIDHWAIDHTPGGFVGFIEQLSDADPDVVSLVGGGVLGGSVAQWLSTNGYDLVRARRFNLYFAPEHGIKRRDLIRAVKAYT